MKKLLLSLSILLSINSFAQKEQEKITIKPYGYVGFDAFVDTRLSTTSRYNHVYLYPNSPEYDANGTDINDQSQYDFGAGITRLGFTITGPSALGAKTTAKIESDFLGTSSNSKDYTIRLRHAFVNLDWGKSSLLIGQTWHPLFVAENYPSLVNYVVGCPIHPLSRNPQIRYTYKATSDLSLSAYVMGQGDFKNSGALEQVEYADIPEFDVQLKFGSPKKFFAAATFGVKQVRPVELDDGGVISDQTVTSTHANISIKYTTPAVTFKAEGVYGGNMTNLVMIGGIARKTQDGETTDEYVAIKTSSVWTDIHTNGERIKFGFFAGITNNLGTTNESTVLDTETSYTRGSNIEKVLAYAPRATFHSGPVIIGLELLRTTASYGTINDKSKPENSEDYSNNRITLGVRYYF